MSCNKAGSVIDSPVVDWIQALRPLVWHLSFPISPGAPKVTDWLTVGITAFALAAAVWAGVSARRSSNAARGQLDHMAEHTRRAAASTTAMWISREEPGKPIVAYVSDWPIFQVLVCFDIDGVHDVVQVPLIGPAKEPKEARPLTTALFGVLAQLAKQRGTEVSKEIGMDENVAQKLAVIEQAMLAFPEVDGLTALRFAFVDMNGHHWLRGATGELESVSDITQVPGMREARVVGTGRS